MSIELRRRPTEDEVEQICTAAEEAARRELLAKVSIKQVSDLDVTVEAIGDKPLLLSVYVALELSSGNEDLQDLVDQATNAAFAAADMKAKELDLCEDTRA
jgi:DNA-binding protein YbaB